MSHASNYFLSLTDFHGVAAIGTATFYVHYLTITFYVVGTKTRLLFLKVGWIEARMVAG